MKIKLFETFKSESSEYYKKLTDNEYINLYDGEIIDINKKFFDKIKNSLSDKFRCNKTYIRSKYSKDHNYDKGLNFRNYKDLYKWGNQTTTDIHGINISSRIGDDSYTILELDDEYFIVRKLVKDIMSGPYNNEYSYYKCDQFDGLLKFLKDEKLIKVEN